MNIWFQHGTKVLGVLISLFASASLLTPEMLGALAGDKAPKVGLLIVGGLTFLRGFKNALTQGSQE